MINYTTNRSKYILKPTVPAGTTDISYTVSIGGNLVFLGKTKYFGGDYEVDCSDWIDAYIASKSQIGRPMTRLMQIIVTVVFTYSGGTSQTMTLTWEPDLINLEDIIIPPYVDDSTPPYACLMLLNSGFYINDPAYDYLIIPLSFHNKILDGKTINHLDKVTYTNKYGDVQNLSVSNYYEIECFIDPCWLHVETGLRNYQFQHVDIEYEKVMLALQSAPYSLLKTYLVNISGIEWHIEPRTADVHIKDVEKIETYSSYSTDKKVPTLKITLEAFI